MGGFIRNIGSVVLGLAVLVPDASAQRPRFGIGVTGGIILGSQLVDHRFTTELDGRSLDLEQSVHQTEVALVSVHAEWYATSHVALRAHGAWGAGELRGVMAMPDGADLDEASFLSGLGDVRVSALDAGVSLWPLAPRGTGFAPFVTIGYGVVNYEFSNDADPAARFFLADGQRSREALLIGAGADMLVWEGVTLRMEAINHMTDGPIGPADFAIRGQDPTGAASRFGSGVSNVRLVLGAHVYFPFVAGSMLTE